jgi:hypothetical protein
MPGFSTMGVSSIQLPNPINNNPTIPRLEKKITLPVNEVCLN